MFDLYYYLRIFAAVHGISVHATRRMFRKAGLMGELRSRKSFFGHEGGEKTVRWMRKALSDSGIECPPRVIERYNSCDDIRYPIF